MKKSRSVTEKTMFIGMALAGLMGGAVLISSFIGSGDNYLVCLLTGGPRSLAVASYSPTETQLRAILHYATSSVVPQQSLAEISVSFDVLKSRAPCNFLVFGLGHDSLMWTSLNPRGTTLFLEEDPKWVQTVLKDAPELRAHTVKYRTQLSQADNLLSSYRSEPQCSPRNAVLRGNTRCRLALDNLPDEVYEKEWDLIMIDAPRGYFAEAPGRMGAIFSATVMARNRKGSGVTHIFLHDVDRRVEKMFAEEFLCRKNLVKAVGRLWHFEIPSAANVSDGGSNSSRFC
ncbi:probable methyltransferase At1g27930 [Juglans microcarpa x Juglans regia]|uniref:probable methyltransferase At1g27930 n=1 Tax=Juglans microcarpa x Juglans regia TaxID=2249226 RepID=UPI001B7E1CF3|nr:probable methyltransferase At1g27930 [Juglans microcarpa x Juglans regia]